ncbi:MAG: PIN domain-containing protein [Pedobacter sp.]|nr:MAG: PIN domain-containing protein [Pedobacter sp.]
MKIDFIADTNFLIYVHEGHKMIEPFLDYNFGISFISEIELLGFAGITQTEENKLQQLINDCFGIEWNTKIKEQTIQLRRKHSIKLPDAIIASTSLVYGIPLVTADKGFSRIEELDLVLIDI